MNRVVYVRIKDLENQWAHFIMYPLFPWNTARGLYDPRIPRGFTTYPYSRARVAIPPSNRMYNQVNIIYLLYAGMFGIFSSAFRVE